MLYFQYQSSICYQLVTCNLISNIFSQDNSYKKPGVFPGLHHFVMVSMYLRNLCGFASLSFRKSFAM